MPVTWAPTARRRRAAATPLRASPTTVTRRPASDSRYARPRVTMSTSCPSVITVARSVRPAPSVGGLPRGTTRLRPACRVPFHRRSVRPAPSVGGLPRGAPPPAPHFQSPLYRGPRAPGPPRGALQRRDPPPPPPSRHPENGPLHAR